MTNREDVRRRLDALKGCPAPEFHGHFSAALRQFRFIPAAERRASADAVFLQAMDRFISEEGDVWTGPSGGIPCPHSGPQGHELAK